MASADSKVESKVELTIKDLKKKRASIKCRLTLLKKYVSSFEHSILTVQQRAELKLRMQGSQNLLSDFNQIQGQIESSIAESDIEKQLELREEYEREYYSILALAECMANTDRRTADESKCTAGSKYVNLPTISVPGFDGSLDQWLEFRNVFLSLVHDCTVITPIQKFHYLKSSLKGNAKSVIDSLEFSANNYEVAWELLLNRFDNVRLLIHNHVKSIFSMPSLSKESATQLRKLIDNVLKNLRALKLLGEPTEYWDTLIIYIVVSKLDPNTEREWEEYKCLMPKTSGDSKINLKLDDLLGFLKNRAEIFETLIVSHTKSSAYNTNENKKQSYNTLVPRVQCNVVSNKSVGKSHGRNTRNNAPRCSICSAYHHLYSCQKFLSFDLQNRLQFVKENGLCINCMRSGHSVDTCMFGPCRKCDKKHNSLLCDASGQDSNSRVLTLVATNEQSAVPATRPPSIDNTRTHTHSLQAHDIHAENYNAPSTTGMQPVLLSTAVIEILNAQTGSYCRARAVLDSGSERSFITKSLCDKLRAQKLQSTQYIHGVGSSVTQSSQVCVIELKSLNENFSTRIQCLVLPQITSKLPAVTVNVNQFNIPNNITLADPNFFDSQPIDLLLGADLFWELLSDGRIRLTNGPFLQNTRLGWVVSGSIPSQTKKYVNRVHCNHMYTTDNRMNTLDESLRRFWELEELPASSNCLRSDEEQACEEHFVKSTTRLADGRFCVRIPFKQSPATLGGTRTQAERRFYALEKRLQRNSDYKNMYVEFINEYIKLGHMRRVSTYGTPHYFLPHHEVFRPYATTSKLRVVFDASMRSNSGVSLNDLQMIGPAIQGDLISILLKFRENRYVACADIEKMYRQVVIDEDQRDLQLILWREHPSESLGVYQLNTVTYGTASAPFLSCRCLKQLARDCGVPEVAQTINDNFYVDDLICGASTTDELIKLCDSTSQVLSSGCFVLRKWVFNFDRANPDVSRQHEAKQLSLGDHRVQNKTLGLGWNNNSDELCFYTQIEETTDTVTKRIILSNASQIYDPLGLLSPTITIAKMLLQKCWLLKLGWDEPVPIDVAEAWNKFIKCLSLLSSLQIPRHVMCIEPVHMELHIFTDASQVAYGSCAYIRSVDYKSGVTVRLLCSKGKVAPVKPTTIPRLELCGALVGARLYAKISESVRSKFTKVVFWTDSTIVLGWLGMPSNLLKTYVQNRTAEIHELTKDHSWRHVSGVENPADLVSRGQHLDALGRSSLWWQGPQFLHDPNFKIPNLLNNLSSNNLPNADKSHILPEIKSNIVLSHLSNRITSNLFPFYRFSQFNRIKRATAYVLRFIHNLRNNSTRRTGLLTVHELEGSELVLAKLSQQESFPDVYDALVRGECIRRHSQLSKLNLFLDDDKLIRVGGRIQNSPDFTYEKIHPILISAKHQFATLLFRYQHRQTLHAAPQLLLFTLRETWWPVGGRDLARRVVHSCVTCARLRATTVHPIMASLPRQRLEPGVPFMSSGVDYAGPVLILNRKGRGAKLMKAYICLFVCFVTRAVHLELVSDLTSDSYLLALKRFISRRGKPSEIYSDNGKNFVGVKNEFANFLNACSDEIKEYASSVNIKFKMIPPYASHFGGLWEAGVKSCKHHLRRVVGNAHLTFEEFSTVLTQVEAVLNSRPMTPMSTDPHDFLPLSPAHFLVGRPLTAPVTADIQHVPRHRLTRYQRVEQIRQHFWTRWSKEYVSELQTRSKWQQHKGDLTVNTLVLLKDDNLPPLRWSLGRIVKTFPGKDGISRVADIRTKEGIIRRAFSKICPLPLHDE